MIRIHKLVSVIAIILFIISCGGKTNSSKVGTEEGTIKVIQQDITDIYTIDEISYEVSNDTTNLFISAIKNNSTSEYLYIGLQNITNLTTQKYSISETEEEINYVYVKFVDTNNISCITKEGYIEVLKYQYNILFQARFEVKFTINNTDTIIAKGEINLSFASFDHNRIPNIPLSPGTFLVNINDTNFTLNCVASHITDNNTYLLNGISKTGETIVIEMNGIEPKIKKEYTIGVPINDNGLISVYYVNKSNNHYIIDGKNSTTGKLKIQKITYNSFQGYFEGIAYCKSINKYTTFRNGKFYAKLKIIN